MRARIALLAGFLAMQSIGCSGADISSRGSSDGGADAGGANCRGCPGLGRSDGGERGGDVTGSSDSGSSGGGHVKLVFVTSSTYPANFGSADNADAKCQVAAAERGAGGSWRAWISSGSVNAIDRIADVGPWYLVDGVTKVFNNKSNLQTTPLHQIDQDELGRIPDWYDGSPIAGIWTGTAIGGTATFGGDCSGWTSTSSDDSGSSAGITSTQLWGGDSNTAIPCGESQALICFEQ